MFRGSGVGDTSSVTLGCKFSFSSTVCVGVTGADCAGIGVDGTGLGGIGVGGGAAIAGTIENGYYSSNVTLWCIETL